MRICTIALIIIGVMATPVMADWTQFRGAGGNSAVKGNQLPAEWSADKNVAWRRPLPGRGPASPIVVGDRVFVTASAGVNQDRLYVLAFAADSGEEIWRRQFWATGRTLSHPSSANAAPTPVSDGKHILAFFSSNDLICLDLDGNLKWYRGLAYDYPKAGNDVGMASSPVISGETVIVQVESQGDSFAAGIDIATGQERWRIARPKGANWSSPIVLTRESGDVLLLQSPGPGVSGHNPRTGEELWKFEGACASAASPFAAGGMLFVPRNGLTAFRLSGPTAPELLWEKEPLRSNYSSPVYFEGRLFVLSGAVAKCADAKTGEELWKTRLKGRRFWATPIVTSSRIYYISEEGNVQILDTQSGKVLARGEMNDTIMGSPAVGENALFIRSEKQLWKISAK